MCAVGLILLLQGPAMLTQELAWAGMLVTYTQDRGLARGVAETFDGNHPCSMCLKASKLKEDEGGGNPSENRRDHSKRVCLAWVAVVQPAWLRWRNLSPVDILVAVPLGPLAASGRGRDVPVTPPPERV